MARRIQVCILKQCRYVGAIYRCKGCQPEPLRGLRWVLRNVKKEIAENYVHLRLTVVSFVGDPLALCKLTKFSLHSFP